MTLELVDKTDERQREVNRRRTALNRKYQSIIRALTLLLESGFIEREEYEDRVDRASNMKKFWLDENLKIAGGRRCAGRSRSETSLTRSERKCARFDCSKLPAPGQAYCCREHAPYGNYGLDPQFA